MEEKSKELSNLFLIYGLTEETLRLSQELDIPVVKEQRRRLEEWKAA